MVLQAALATEAQQEKTPGLVVGSGGYKYVTIIAFKQGTLWVCTPSACLQQLIPSWLQL